jgi:cytochrome c heme-lyase
MSSESSKSGSPSSGGGGCPINHGNRAASNGGCPVKHTGLPYKDKQAPFGLPSSIEESAMHPQAPLSDQKIPLSTRREVSSIPRADELRPEEEGRTAPHQPKSSPQWVYPSEQQFYAAMRRKGWQGVDERTIPAVVRIHNAVNERGWTEVQQWERELHGCDNPRLVRFLGRPNDLSPRAWAHTYLLGNRPFDRHDWFVDRGDGKEPRRYVIDFYSDEKATNSAGMYLDVRPALDNPEAFADRMKMFVRDAFPGISNLFRSNSSVPSDGSTPPRSDTSS